MRRFCFLAMFFCLPFIFSIPAMAQSSASIVGTVMDSSGAAMPSVKILVSNRDQAIERPTVTDSAGAYKVGFLPIGKYTVSAESPGFQKYLQTGVALQIGQVQRLDITMKVGTTTQEITVTGNVVKVQTDDSVLSSVVTGNQIQAINLNGRQFVALATLVPGASVTNSYNPSASQGESLNSNINFNGTRFDQSDWAADGGNLVNFFANGNFHTTPSLESIGEFKISTSNYEADQGLRAGAAVEISTKSGTRDFHGAMYEYIRNQVWDANSWFVNRQLHPKTAGADWNAPKTPLKWNDFGFTLGGPFYIPGHYNTSKDKTFVFWSSEWRRIRRGTTLSASAPTARMRNGDFSECDNTSPNYNSQISGCVIPKDPATGEYYTREGNGLVPVAPQSKMLLDTWVPLPNNGPTGYINSPSIPNNWRQNLIRVDQNIGEKNRVYVRMTNDKDGYYAIPALYTSSVYDSIRTFYGGNLWNWAGHVTTTFTPSIVNDFMAHYDDRQNKRYNIPGVGWPEGVLAKPAGWSMPTLFAANQSMPVMPGFTVSGGGVNFSEDTGYFPQWTTEWNQEYQDTLQITKSNHYIKMGVNFTYSVGDFNNSPTNAASATAEGTLNFSTASSLTTGNALADMHLGRIYSYLESSAAVNGVPVGGYFGFRFHVWRLEPYFQDNWRVNRRLTLNLGVRAFYLTPWQDDSAAWNLRWHGVASPIIAGFYPSLFNPAFQAPLNASGNITPNPATGQIFSAKMWGNGLVRCGQGGIPKGCQFSQGARFAPRFGFAYQPFNTPSTVIRGGYGVFYDQLAGNDSSPISLIANLPIYQVSSANNINGYGAISPAAYGPAPESMTSPNMPYPMSQQFSFGVQRELKGDNRLSVTYVGNLVHHNARSFAFNRVSVGTNTKNVPALAGTSGCDASGNCDVQANLINQYHSINFFRPYQGFTTITQRNTSASSNYQALQAELRHPVGHGLTLQAAYTYSKWMNDSDSYSVDPNVDDDNLKRYWARSNYNRTQILSLQYVYDLPFLKNASNQYVKNAFGGWQITGVSSFFTGLPVNMGCSISGKGTGVGANAYCNSLGAVRIQKGVDNNPTYGPTPSWYNPNNVGQLTLDQLSANGQPGMFGWMGINTLTGPGRNNWDLALLKNFSAPWFKGEHSTFQFRWETYNTFNHSQWQGVSSGCDSATPAGNPCGYAVISNKTYNLGRGDVSSAWPQRIMQFALKFIF